jgi:hypothetical protein
MKRLSAISLCVVSVVLVTGCQSNPSNEARNSAAIDYANVTYSSASPSPEARRGLQSAEDAAPKPATSMLVQTQTQTQTQADRTTQITESNANIPTAPNERIRITAVGYGAEVAFEGMSPGQRRLMAIRASKLDAYRSLAEQLYGVSVDSNTAVASLAAQNDSFRARVNATVKGARVISITPMADNNFETVIEVFVDRQFFDQVFVKQYDSSPSVMTPNQVR